MKPDLSRGLETYREEAIRLSQALLRTGAGRGVLTFSRPVSAVELSNLVDVGLEILAVEAVTEEYDGVRGTYFGLYGDHVWSEMSDLAEEFSTAFVGVTAAEVIVADVAVFDAIIAAPDVLLVDLGVEHARRETGEKDVVMNDLYWYHAGWANP